LIVTTAEDCVTFDDARGHQDRLLADPDFDPSFDQLIDASHVTNIDLSADEVRILASRRVVSPESRRAIVAAKPHIFGLGRMMEIFHEDLGYADAQVFYSIDEAMKWLESGQEKTSES
jgi:hypothetical protein